MALASQDELIEKTVSNIAEVKVRGGKVLAVTAGEKPEIEHEADCVWHIPEIREIFRPIITILPMQMFAYYMALERGCDIDKPRNLAKSVTVE